MYESWLLNIHKTKSKYRKKNEQTTYMFLIKLCC